VGAIAGRRILRWTVGQAKQVWSPIPLVAGATLCDNLDEAERYQLANCGRDGVAMEPIFDQLEVELELTQFGGHR
jgi:hypothetical protein